MSQQRYKVCVWRIEGGGRQLTVYLIQGNVLKKGDIGARLMCLKKDYLAKGNNTGKNI